MKIALDAMGGDFGPSVTVRGAIEAAPHIQGEILLVGKEDAIQSHLPSNPPANVRIVHAPNEIEMGEEPANAVRRKKDSSLVVAAKMVKTGEADAFVSAGNTGAVTAAAHLFWKCAPSISRPAIATILPSRRERFVLIDSGATPDASVRNLLEFAVMGTAYAEAVLGIEQPKVALLNIGEEPSKGNALTKEAYKAFSAYLPNFAGNIEGKALFHGGADVVVCDAFVGNVLLKTAEGLGSFVMEMFKESVPKNPILRLPLLLLRKGLEDMKRKMDYAEIGGAPLLGVNGICFICHGHSDEKAIRNALLNAHRGYVRHLTDLIEQKACTLKGAVNA
ncbi:MAG: phosphate acyltransferase PlsX [Armatimonadetes bacterium]|nr:MAG: phosphate acyltransferase PlsX [Armatimonadota bacterium]